MHTMQSEREEERKRIGIHLTERVECTQFRVKERKRTGIQLTVRVECTQCSVEERKRGRE